MSESGKYGPFLSGSAGLEDWNLCATHPNPVVRPSWMASGLRVPMKGESCTTVPGNILGVAGGFGWPLNSTAMMVAANFTLGSIESGRTTSSNCRLPASSPEGGEGELSSLLLQ